VVRRQPSKLIFVGSNPISRSGLVEGCRSKVQGWFETFNLQPLTFNKTGPVAQRLAQATHNRLVVGSNPTGPTVYYC
jgi:hypothetical protein